jgi:hypothetical protein
MRRQCCGADKTRFCFRLRHNEAVQEVASAFGRAAGSKPAVRSRVERFRINDKRTAGEKPAARTAETASISARFYKGRSARQDVLFFLPVKSIAK